MTSTKDRNFRSLLSSRSGLVLLGFLAVTAYLLWAEHRVHLINALPWVLVAGCLLMHLFMHHGHKGHGDSSDSGDIEGRNGADKP